MKPVTYNCALTVDNVIFTVIAKQLAVVLVKRKYGPYEGMWALPGGFVEDNEETPAAAARELEEETGLKQIKLQRFGSFDAVGRNPRGRTVAIGYYGVTAEKPVVGADDAALAEWTPLRKVKTLAFDHNKILQEAITQFQHDIFISSIAKPLLRKKMTSAKILETYAIVLNKKTNATLITSLLNAKVIKLHKGTYTFTNKTIQELLC